MSTRISLVLKILGSCSVNPGKWKVTSTSFELSCLVLSIPAFSLFWITREPNGVKYSMSEEALNKFLKLKGGRYLVDCLFKIRQPAMYILRSVYLKGGFVTMYFQPLCWKYDPFKWSLCSSFLKSLERSLQEMKECILKAKGWCSWDCGMQSFRSFIDD